MEAVQIPDPRLDGPGALVFYFLLGPDRFLIPALSASMIALALLRGPVTRERSRHA